MCGKNFIRYALTNQKHFENSGNKQIVRFLLLPLIFSWLIFCPTVAVFLQYFYCVAIYTKSAIFFLLFYLNLSNSTSFLLGFIKAWLLKKNEVMEKEIKSLKEERERENEPLPDEENIVIPVIKEFLNVDKKVVETGKVLIKKRIENEEKDINIPLQSETYEVERIAVRDHLFDEPPQVRNEGNKMIIPVVREIVEVRKRYEVTEEIHITKKETVTQHKEKVTLKKEKVSVEREAAK